MAKYTLMQTKQTKERFILINTTGEKVFELIDPAKYAELRKKAIASIKRSQKEELMYDCGLTKGKDSCGRIIWE